MQIVIALPEVEQMPKLDRPVCGVPLLTRIIATAVRSGASTVLLLLPRNWPLSWLHRRLHLPMFESVVMDAKDLCRPFDPDNPEDWRTIADRLDEQFAWIPYDYEADEPPLSQLLAAASCHRGLAVRFDTVPADRIFTRPTVLLKRALVEGVRQPFEVVG